jgi:hypothetical protein
VLLSWLEQVSGRRHRFRFATWKAGAWTPPATIAERDDFFVNWADVPSLLPIDDGSLVAQWLVSTGPRTAYDVNLSTSRDGGRTWSAPVVPHRDGTKTEHGFVSLVAAADGPAFVWLDGRDFANHGEGHGPGAMKAQMALRSADLRDGAVGPEQIVDARVCDCCPTAAARTSAGVIVAYRDRSAEEIRDISVARREGGRWLPPARVHADNWKIPGCPVNGPALAAQGRRVALAWFTAADNSARVYVALSDDGGATFGPPQRMDDGLPLGRVDAALLADGTAVVSWIEHNSGKPEIRIRRTGEGSRSLRVAPISGDRASGFPRMARAGDRLLLAWTAIASGKQVKVATIATGVR